MPDSSFKGFAYNIADLGPQIASYACTGEVITSQGSLRCEFEAAQLKDGSIACAFKLLDRHGFGAPVSVRGTAAEGRSVECLGSPLTTDSYYSSEEPSRFLTWFNTLTVRDSGHKTTTRLRYGITNFKFFGTEVYEEGGRNVLSLPLRLWSPSREWVVRIVPIGDHNAAGKRLGRTKGIDVTAEVLVEMGVEDQISTVDAMAGELCHVLSIARGTAVQWLYRGEIDLEGRQLACTHHHHITKPYSPLPVIDPRAGGRDATKSFIETAYPNYLKHRERFHLAKGVIAGYLDSRIEIDYLEMRGVKAAVAMEMIKAAYLDGLPTVPHEFCMEPQQFQGALVSAVSKAIRGVLKEANIDKRLREKMTAAGKLQGLNRRSFAEVVRDMCKYIDLYVAADEVKLLVHIRNNLIHRGRFYCETATADDRERCPPKDDPWQEYQFLIDFLDRFFLTMLGYSGPYVDWRGTEKFIEQRGPPNPRPASSV
jgi:hypothetical protein